MVRAITVCLVAAFQFESPVLCVLGIVFILPMMMRIHYYDNGIARIAAYMVVYIEPILGIKWETRNENVHRPCGRDSGSSLAPWFLFWICVVSWLALVVQQLDFKCEACRVTFNNDLCTLVIDIISLVAVVVFGVIICVHVCQNNKYHEGEKGGWKEAWKSLQDDGK